MAKKKDDKEISDKLEKEYQKWVDVYFNFNFNGRLTSKQVKPHLTMGSAEVDAARMLGNARVQELIELKHEHTRMKEQIKLEFLVSQLNGIILTEDTEEIERDGQGEITKRRTKSNNTARIQAMNLLSKIAGFDAPKKIDIKVDGNISLKDMMGFDDEE